MQSSKRNTLRVLLMFAALLVSTSTPVRATTLAQMSLDQLAAAADSVARLRCAATESRWENGAIWTITTFAVVESMKGNLPEKVTVRLPGGRVGHLTATVDGTPKFNPGDDAIVFLERSRQGMYSVTGWVEGTFRISYDPQGNREAVTQDSSALSMFDTATRTFRTEGVRRMPVEQFRARLAAAIERSKEKSR